MDVNYGAFPTGTASGNVNNVTNTSPLSVGANGTTMLPWSREGEFDGMLDDIRVYHRALTPSEISILYRYPHNTVPPGTIYVDANATGANNGTSWQDAYKYLQDALEDANISPGCAEIWVAQGTYRPDEDTAHPDGNDSRTATFQLKNNVAIYGGYPHGGGSRDPNTYTTTLSGDIGTIGNNNDNSYHVVTGSGTNATAVLDGFTITAGNASGSFPYNVGGGMYNNLGSPTVTNCIFSGNSATNGSGIYNNYYSSPTVTNCTFSRNSATNNGGGMDSNSFSNPTVTNCTFSGNSATNGGGMYNYSFSSPIVTNCTFIGNSATSNGGGMSNLSGSNPLVTNCILWGNTAPNGPQIYKDGSSFPTVSYCDVQGGWSEPGWNPDDPNTDSKRGLAFRVTFDDNPDATTTTAVDYMYDSDGEEYTGTLTDYNTAGWDVWEENGKIGTSGDFRYYNDKLPHGAPNDCRVWVDPDGAGLHVLAFGNDTVKRTWAFWFYDVDYNESNVPQPILTESTIIRHQNYDIPNQFWDMYIRNSKLQFRNFGTAKMAFETASDLNSLGVKPMTWHHVVFVIDRTTKFTSKIYLDGIAVDVNYGAFPKGTASGDINPNREIGYPSPLSIGANGTTTLPWSREGEFDGMLDDLRVYHRPLAPSEISILYQYPHTVPPGTGNIDADPCFVDANGTDGFAARSTTIFVC